MPTDAISDVTPAASDAVAQGKDTALGKKVRWRGAGQAATDTSVLQRAMCKAADSYCGMQVDVTAITLAQMPLEDLHASIAPFSLMLQLHGAGGALGVAVLSKEMTAGVVEQVTLGQISASDAAERPASRTDARLSAPLITALLALLPDGFGLQDVTVGEPFASSRGLALMMQQGVYACQTYEVAMSQDDAVAKNGQIIVVTPLAPPAPPPEDAAAQSTSVPAHLGAVMRDARVDVVVTLHRLSWPLGRLETLQVGDTIPIPRGAPQNLEISGPDGAIIGTADLGMLDGFKAIRLHRSGDLNSVGAQVAPTVTPPETVEIDIAAEMPLELQDPPV